jgi:hypothetical protein
MQVEKCSSWPRSVSSSERVAPESSFNPNSIRIVHSVFPSFGARSWISKIRSLSGCYPGPATAGIASGPSKSRARHGLRSEKRSLMELRTAADWTIRQCLLSVPGVGSSERAHSDDLGLNDELSAARRAPGVRGAGFIDTKHHRLVFQTPRASRSLLMISPCSPRYERSPFCFRAQHPTSKKLRHKRWATGPVAGRPEGTPWRRRSPGLETEGRGEGIVSQQRSRRSARLRVSPALAACACLCDAALAPRQEPCG